MAEPFLGEVKLFPINYAPRGWAACNGQILSINQNQALFSLLGAVYGGDGRTTFALPDLRGRVPIHISQQIPLGRSAGEAGHTLTINEMPMHTHMAQASSNQATAVSAQNNAWSDAADNYKDTTPQSVPMAANALSTAGQSQAHNNMQPYLALQFCIAISGIYPSRS
ncbi:phage tail protein [Paenibacillus arenosi]|uniref:Phage tail protein n=1 Tax=Paenibacillus arenosi TaxID=2774142 RepID=A0ABR9AZ96_9BACL|nr:tail fiber protein [Paenibacillus arenosi]MBD8499464.1 phage tail protein [Paenibacillus arenosi]